MRAAQGWKRSLLLLAALASGAGGSRAVRAEDGLPPPPLKSPRAPTTAPATPPPPALPPQALPKAGPSTLVGNAPAPLGQSLDERGTLPPKGWVYQSLQGVLPDMATRLYTALLKGGKSSMSKDGVSVAFEWKVQSGHYNPSTTSFDLTAQMIGDYKIFERGRGPLGWIKGVFAPGDRHMAFRYDKVVLIEYSASTRLLSVTMPEAAEQIGTYNVVVTGKAKSEVSAKPQVNIASKSFGISLTSSKDEYTAAVTGLPYVLAPQLVLDTIGQGRYLHMQIGFNWESRGQLVATSNGLQEKSGVQLALSYGGTDVAAELARTSETQPFEGTIAVKGDGSGLLARLVYMEEVGGWKADLSADQSWQIASSTMPILKVGDVHYAKTEQVNAGSPSAPRIAETRPTQDLVRVFVTATEAIDRIVNMQSSYGAVPTVGVLGAIGRIATPAPARPSPLAQTPQAAPRARENVPPRGDSSP